MESNERLEGNENRLEGNEYVWKAMNLLKYFDL